MQKKTAEHSGAEVHDKLVVNKGSSGTSSTLGRLIRGGEVKGL